MSLTDEQVNERLALAMGWQLIDLDNNCSDPDCCGYAKPDLVWCKEQPDEYGLLNWFQANPDVYNYFDPTTDDNHMRIVRDEIAKRSSDLTATFCTEVAKALNKDNWAVFDLINAPCSIQARAALKVLEGDNPNA